MIKRIISIILGIIVVTIVVLLFIDFRPFVLTSTSMEPTIPKGRLVIVDTRVKHPVIGDIVAYREGEILILHRLVGENLLKGDNSPVAQRVLLNSDNMDGKEVVYIPWIGTILSFLIDHKWILFATAGILVLIIFIASKRRSNEHTNQTHRDE